THDRGCVGREGSVEALVQPAPANAERYLTMGAAPVLGRPDGKPSVSDSSVMARADHGVLFWLDLSGSRRRLDRLGRNAPGELSSPALTRIPRETTKFFGRRPPLRCGPFRMRRRSFPAFRSPSRSYEEWRQPALVRLTSFGRQRMEQAMMLDGVASETAGRELNAIYVSVELSRKTWLVTSI